MVMPECQIYGTWRCTSLVGVGDTECLMQEAWTAEKEALYEQLSAQAEQLQASQEEARALLARFEHESAALIELQRQYNAVRGFTTPALNVTLQCFASELPSHSNVACRCLSQYLMNVPIHNIGDVQWPSFSPFRPFPSPYRMIF